MEVILAGYNVDSSLITKTKNILNTAKKANNLIDESSSFSDSEKGTKLDEASNHVKQLLSLCKEIEPDHFSPETISAANARISRDPRDIPLLRAESIKELEKARKSCEVIVFQMGHHSVAEHAMINFDILKLSRLAIEALESRRIGAGYTEKSQRYITLDGDFVIPEEFNEEDKEKFKSIVSIQNNFYKKIFPILTEYQFKRNPEMAKTANEKKERGVSDKMNREKNTLEGWAKEDARMILCLATEAQVGVSFNARTLEHTIRTLKFSNLKEERVLAKKLYDIGGNVAKGLIFLCDQEEYEKRFPGKKLQQNHFMKTESTIKNTVKNAFEKFGPHTLNIHTPTTQKNNVKLIKCSDHTVNILAAILHSNSEKSIEACYKLAFWLKEHTNESKTFMKECLQHLTAFDPLPREFEIGNWIFEGIISGSCFADFKRHRMMTLLKQPYLPGLGYTIPVAIKKCNLEEEFIEICKKSDTVFNEFKQKYGSAAEYVLTNAHRRRVLIGVNTRELYHLSRLREDRFAQWHIRWLAKNMCDLARENHPLPTLLLCGKDKFQKTRSQVYE